MVRNGKSKQGKSHKLTAKSAQQNHHCNICDKGFDKKCELERHETSHLKPSERPFRCNRVGCGKAFAQQTALFTHQNTHTGDRPHRCAHCPRAFGDPSSRTRHESEIHDPTSGFYCVKCKKRCKRKEQYRTHLIDIHNIKEPEEEDFKLARQQCVDEFQALQGSPSDMPRLNERKRPRPSTGSEYSPPRKRLHTPASGRRVPDQPFDDNLETSHNDGLSGDLFYPSSNPESYGSVLGPPYPPPTALHSDALHHSGVSYKREPSLEPSSLDALSPPPLKRRNAVVAAHGLNYPPPAAHPTSIHGQDFTQVNNHNGAPTRAGGYFPGDYYTDLTHCKGNTPPSTTTPYGGHEDPETSAYSAQGSESTGSSPSDGYSRYTGTPIIVSGHSREVTEKALARLTTGSRITSVPPDLQSYEAYIPELCGTLHSSPIHPDQSASSSLLADQSWPAPHIPGAPAGWNTYESQPEVYRSRPILPQTLTTGYLHSGDNSYTTGHYQLASEAPTRPDLQPEVSGGSSVYGDQSSGLPLSMEPK